MAGKNSGASQIRPSQRVALPRGSSRIMTPALITTRVRSPGRVTGSNWNSNPAKNSSTHQSACRDARASSSTRFTLMNNSRQPPKTRGIRTKLTQGTANRFANRLNTGICW